MPTLIWSFTLFVLVIACGKTGENDAEASAGATPATGGQPSLSNGGAANDTSSRNAAGNASAVDDSRIPATAKVACATYWKFVAGYHSELAQSGGAPSEGPMPTEDEVVSGPCFSCLASCEREHPTGCESSEACVERHCSQAPVDICECAASCAGPNDDACLTAWVDYAVCVSQACTGLCEGS